MVCLNETVREPIHVNVEPDVFDAIKAALTEMQQSILLTCFFNQPATHEARGRLVLRLLCGFCVCIYIYIYICMCVCTYHVRNNYVTYIVAMRPYFGRLRQLI